MHSEYLRSLFLGNDLAAARFRVGGRPVALTDIRAPVFCLGTETDHVAPWRSVYKLHLLTDTEIIFVLTTGGHNAGVVSRPGHARRSYRVHTQAHGDKYLDPEQYLAHAKALPGSWWPEWQRWLAARSSAPALPPRTGAPERGVFVLGDAPGQYVLMK
jgi:polyhydroxyalkanoate synthase